MDSGTGEDEVRRAALMAQSPEQTTLDEAPRLASPALSLSARFTPPRSRWQSLVSGVSILVVVAVVGVVVTNILGLGRIHTSAPKDTLQLNVASSGLHCVMNVAWSPDSSRVALLGSTGQDCSGSVSNAPSTVVVIYDARAGKLVSTLHPDTPVFGAPEVKRLLNGAENPDHLRGIADYISYTWAPDGQSLLMFFAVNLNAPLNQTPQYPQTGDPNARPGVDGVLRLHVSGSAQTTLWFEQPNPSFHTTTPVTIRWDLVRGIVEYVPQPPTATAYRWTADGSLTPMSATTDGPVGQPDGDTSFTIWQTGLMMASSPPNNGSSSSQLAPVPQGIVWNAHAQAVSPDGRFYYPSPTSTVSLAPPSTKQVYPMVHAVQPHDKAQLALATHMMLPPQDASLPNGYENVELSWRADGRILAYVTQQYKRNQDGAVTEESIISLYDTATGKVLKTLVPDMSGLHNQTDGVTYLSWSPDGSHLLCLENTFGAITIWGPGALPK